MILQWFRDLIFGKKAFGPHLTIDLKYCNREKLLDLDYINNFINTLPAKIGMNLIKESEAFYYDGLIPEDAGPTSIGILAQSHISYHAFPYRDNYLFIDVFSCKEFDTKATIEHILEAFAAENTTYKYKITKRGLDFNRN